MLIEVICGIDYLLIFLPHDVPVSLPNGKRDTSKKYYTHGTLFITLSVGNCDMKRKIVLLEPLESYGCLDKLILLLLKFLLNPYGPTYC